MTTTKFYLDTRSTKRGEKAPLKIAINKHGRTAFFPTNIKLLSTQWDAKRQKILEHPNKQRLNSFLEIRKVQVDEAIRELTVKGNIVGLSATQVKNKVVEYLDPQRKKINSFVERFKVYIERCNTKSTKEKYKLTLDRIKLYDKNSSDLMFEDITKDWLVGFETFLSNFCKSKNSRNIQLRCIRAVFNDARDNNVTSHYPFRKLFRITPEPTRKRSLSVEQLRSLMQTEVEPYQERYRDAFMLTFYLIGINTIDLLENAVITNGRLEYKRSKTGKIYSIKIEPEAELLLNKYRGRNNLLIFRESYKNYHTFTAKCDKGLKEIGPTELVENKEYKKGGRKLPFHKKHISAFPGLSLYWARHTWATIAYQLDIPNETIAAALGHSFGNQTTAIYINPNRDKIDEANRKVIDFVLEKGI